MAASSTANRLRTHAHRALTEEECSTLKASIRRFRETHSVLGLCSSLKGIIDYPDKIHLLPYVSAMIPSHLRDDFEKLCKLQYQCHKPHSNLFPGAEELPRKQNESRRKSGAPTRIVEGGLQRPIEEYANIKNAHRKNVKTMEDWDCYTYSLSRRKNSSASGETDKGLHKRSKTYHSSSTTPNQSSTFNSKDEEALKRELIKELSARNSSMIRTLSTSTDDGKEKGKVVRKVILTRRDGKSLGFAIRGGKDLNAGIFISEVDHGGQAEKRGLKAGERILKVNDRVFDDVTHAQAVVCLKSAQQLTMFVAPLGQMPGGTPNSTPRSTCSSAPTSPSAHSSHDSREGSVPCRTDTNGPRKIVVMADEDGWLGFSIRGGVDQGIEPCIAHVDPQSPASRAGLSRGMRIHKVNETPVSGMNHLYMVHLVTVTRVVVLHVTEGSLKQRRSIAGKAQMEPADQNENEESFFLKDLEFTPPMHSSTPLPQAGSAPPPPYNPRNFLQRFRRRTTDHDATIIQVMKEDAKSLPRKSNRKPSRKQTPQQSSASQEGVNAGNGMAKLDGGTIKLNLAGESGNGRDDSSGKSVGDKHRLHIKDIFKSSPTSDTSQSPTNATNVLSTPVLSHKNMTLRAQALSPSSSELRDARFEAARQIRGELTGKNQPIPFTPNVPPSPVDARHRPSPGMTLSKIFGKVARRSLGEELTWNCNMGDNLGGFRHQMEGVGMGTSAYQMMRDRNSTSADQSTFLT